jgi:hypothetical protein
MNAFSFSPSFAILPAALAIGLGLGLIGCNQPESPMATPSPAEQPAESPRAPTAFERDWLALKAQGLSPKAMAEAAPALRAKYGLPPVAQLASQERGIPTEVADAVAPQALGKAASLGMFKYEGSKSGRVIFYFAHYRDVAVGPGQTLIISADAVDPGTDPVVIAFYKTTASANPAAYQVKIVAWNDDYSGVNSSASWTNNTGSSKPVRVLSYVYAPENSGKTSFSVIIPSPFGGTFYSYHSTRFTSAAPIYDNQPINPYLCASPIGPFNSRIRLDKEISAGYGTGILAFNSGTMTGGYIRETSATLDLDAVLPGGAPNMVLGFYEGKNFTYDDIPNLPYSNFFYYQDDQYLCH